jgi:hypothetical protein
MSNLEKFLDKLTEVEEGDKFPQVRITLLSDNSVFTIMLVKGLYRSYGGPKENPYNKRSEKVWRKIQLVNTFLKMKNEIKSITFFKNQEELESASKSPPQRAALNNVNSSSPQRVALNNVNSSSRSDGNRTFKNAVTNNSWKPAAASNQNFKNAVNANKNNGPSIGEKSSFGTVTKIGGKFVKKTMKFNQSGNTKIKIFLNEIRVGSTPGIKKVGPKIYAWRLHLDSSGKAVSGEYIMDDFRIAPRGYKVVSFNEYVRLPLLVLKDGAKTTLRAAPQRLRNFFYLKLKYYLTEFWRITKGYHGDLHLGNIAVMYKESTGKVQRFIIFDYGAHKKFKTSINNLKFEQLTNIIDKEFKNRYTKTQSNEYYPPGSGIRLSRSMQGQPRRPNTDMLRSYAYTGVIAPGANLMSRMTSHNNYKKRLSRVPDYYANPKLTHSNRKKAPVRLFLRENNYKEAVANAHKQSGRPRNVLVDSLMKKYPEKTKEEVLRALRIHFKNYNSNKYNINEREGRVYLSAVPKSEFMNMLNNLYKKTPVTETL